MNRTDELTDHLIDGTLTDAEAVELESLLATDPSAQARYLASVRLELVLRGLRTEFDLADPTVAKIEADRVERTTAVVMAELANRSAPVPTGSGRSRGWLLWAALAASLFLAVWLGLRPPGAPNGSNEPRPDAPEFARLITVSGSVEIVGPGGVATAHRDQLLAADQTLRTVGEESVAIVEFPDRTRVEIHPESVVRFGPEAAAEPARVLLVQGRITATATGSRVVVGAGATDVEASRGSFSLWSAGAGSARVEPMDGDVRISRGAPTETVVVGPGRAAFLGDDETSVKIDSQWRLETTPRSQLDFKALDVGIAPDGDVWAVSARQWARWKPGTPDPGRTLFHPKVFNDGQVAWLTPDQRFVAMCRTDEREERITVRELPSGDVRGQIPIRVSEARFLCVPPDASWLATTGSPKPNQRLLRVWDVGTGNVRFATDLDNTVTCLASSPDGRTLAVGVSDLGRGTTNSIVMFDTATGEQTCQLLTQRKGIYTLSFSADGKHLAAGFNGAIQVWNLADRNLQRTIEGFERVVTRVAWSPGNKLIAAGTQDGQVWVWTLADGRRTQILDTGTRGVRSLAFSPDGKVLVTATNRAPIAVWDVAPDAAKAADPDS
ncbi:MAG: hypothetical protein U0792_20460 [Gemmataceae bacterium]